MLLLSDTVQATFSHKEASQEGKVDRKYVRAPLVKGIWEGKTKKEKEKKRKKRKY